MNQSVRSVVVATIGRAHGLRGEVSVFVRTDQPRERLQPGTVFTAQTSTGSRTLTVKSARQHQRSWLVSFREIPDRTAAEQLHGSELELEVDLDDEAATDPDAWYPEDLVGLHVVHADGTDLGAVDEVQHYPAHDVLIVRAPAGARVMLPFVEALVPDVDIEAGVITADPPGGLFPESTDGSEGRDESTRAEQGA